MSNSKTKPNMLTTPGHDDMSLLDLLPKTKA